MPECILSQSQADPALQVSWLSQVRHVECIIERSLLQGLRATLSDTDVSAKQQAWSSE